MLENKVLVNELDNEDVIATSSTCETAKYHLYVDLAFDDDSEICTLMATSGGYITKEYDFYVDPVPSIFSSHNTYNGYLMVELGPDAQEDDVYHYTGSKWVKCDKTYSQHTAG